MKSVKVYTTNYCPYCVRAKQLLKSRGVPFEEILVDGDDPNVWQEMFQRSGMKTVPQIFFGDECIGGYTDLEALDRSGKLQEKLA